MSAQSDPKKAAYPSEQWKLRAATKRPNHRPYRIEWRYVGKLPFFTNWRNWHRWKAYETQKQRDQVLEQLRKNSVKDWEYRAVDQED